ncbi:hypothetical protein ACFLXE_00360 [Chloroflexota bacterium]
MIWKKDLEKLREQAKLAAEIPGLKRRKKALEGEVRFLRGLLAAERK